MRLGFDIDDTICNTHFVLMKYAIKYNNEHGNKPLLKYDTNDFSQVFGWNSDEVNNFFRTYYLDALKEIEPKFGVKEAFTKLKEMGHEIIFITIRNDRECTPRGEALRTGEARRITEEWLNEYGIPYDELYVDISNKGQCCIEHNIDLFMDDSEKHCLAVSSLGITTFMAMNCFNLSFQNDKIEKIYSMKNLCEAIEKL
jgi:uncharacterized HAD superfamily protein